MGGRHTRTTLDAEPATGLQQARPSIAIIEDDALVARVLSRWVVRAGFAPRVADGARRGVTVLEPAPFGVIVDVRLGDGSGLDVVARARELVPDVPVLVVSGYRDDEAINRTQLLGAEYAQKPDIERNVASFLRRCRARTGAPCAMPPGLSPAEAKLVAAALVTTSHAVLAAELGLSENTVKFHIRGVLAKTGAESLEVLVAPIRARLLGRAPASSGAPPPDHCD